MRDRKRNTMILKVLILILVIIVAVLALIQGVRIYQSKSVNTSEGIALIEAQQDADIQEIETKIDNLEAKDGTVSEQVSLKERFGSAVVVGDSITQSLLDYNILNASSVVASVGASLNDTDEAVEQVVALNPQVIFLEYGINDILVLNGDTDLFIAEYRTLIETLRERLPDTKIFINSILPVTDQPMKEQPLFEKIPEFNEALLSFADRQQITFIDNADLAEEDLYEADGIHMKEEYYPLWANKMAEVASL